MSVLIKGMEMPTSCPCELLGIGYDVWCSFAGGIPARVKEYDECCQNDTRPSWCPLVPVPPHGRLGDLDTFESIKYELPEGQKAFNRGFHSGVQYVQRLIMDAPTIIPAEEGET